MSKGDVPIPYIIALLLGIAVVAIIGYWFFVLGGTWGGTATLDQCKIKAHTWCADWQKTGYSFNPDTGKPSIGWFADANVACRTYEDAMGLKGDSDNEAPAYGTVDTNYCKSVLLGA